jgi:hypothetical protein
VSEQQYVYVVYRVEASYLEGFQEKLDAYQQTEKQAIMDAFEILRRAAAECGEEFDHAEALRSVARNERWRTSPWDLLIKIKEVFLEQEHAAEEVERLNLTARGDSRYFWQGAKFYPEGRKAQKGQQDA